ncbi:MAG: DUF6261 family protein [Bacteroidales bacterium]|jgi:hypothetical protein|nr:DUF6261 family protein [Bacteroidales bacterium]
MKINKFQQRNLRNAEHLQFVRSALQIFGKHNPDALGVRPQYDELLRLQQEEESAISVELGSALTREKDAADSYRDRRHSVLYHYVKSFTYDETEGELFEAGWRILRIIMQVGNPTRLGDHAETTMLVKLKNELAPYHADLLLTGAQPLLDKLTAANDRFVALDEQCRNDKTQRPAGNVKAVRLKTDAVYLSMTDAINVFIVLHGEAPYAALAKDLNALAKDYATLLAQRKGRKPKDEDGEQ